MMTKEEARAAVEAELFALRLRKCMTLPEKIAFCESVHRRLVFQSDTDRLKEILVWAETWQSLWLPDKFVPGENVDFSIGVTLLSQLSHVFGCRGRVGCGSYHASSPPGVQSQVSYSPSSVPVCRRTKTNLTR